MNALLMIASLVLAAPTQGDGAKKYVLDHSQTTTQLDKGSKGTFALNIQVAEGYKVSQEAPLKIKLVSTGLALGKKKLGAKDATEKKWTSPKFKVGFSAEQPGDQKIDVDASFFVCDEHICERQTERLQISVNVRP